MVAWGILNDLNVWFIYWLPTATCFYRYINDIIVTFESHCYTVTKMLHVICVCVLTFKWIETVSMANLDWPSNQVSAVWFSSMGLNDLIAVCASP